MALENYERLIYTNSNNESVEFSIQSVCYVNVSKDVTGISDVKNTLYTTSSMGQHGTTFISQNIDERDIVIKGSLNIRDKDSTLAQRRKLQRILNPELSGTLTYIYKNFVRVIDVKVDNAPIFTRKKVLNDFTVQFLCPNPFWREAAENKQDIASWVASFSFAFEIPDGEGMEFGYREPSVIVDVYNEGDVKVGMRVKFTATGTVDTPLLYNVNTREYIQLNCEMQAGDVITVETGYGEKSVTLLRDGVTTDYFRYVDVDSTFMQLEIGDNVFKYDAAANVDALEVSLYHYNKYLGV